jgi:hypothetical protein
MISRFNKKQTYMALSLAEAKYMVVGMTSCVAIWLRKLLARLFDQELNPMVIHCDNELSNSLRIQCFITGPSSI